jgi:hypothetical protein
LPFQHLFVAPAAIELLWYRIKNKLGLLMSICLAAWMQKKNMTCPRGDACTYAHNVFEYWLHPSRCETLQD